MRSAGAASCGQGHRAVVRDRAGQFDLDQHVDRPVLQRLEGADRNAELLAGLEILDGSAQQHRRVADGLRRERSEPGVDDAFDERQTGAEFAEHVRERHAHAFEGERRRAPVVDRAVVAARDSPGVSRSTSTTLMPSGRASRRWCER
jgi:hypothetical protein